MVLTVCVNVYSYTGTDVTPTADAKINTSTPLFITADELVYSNETSEITGHGNVIAKNDSITIFSNSIYVNSDSGDAIAEGKVLAIQNGSSIYTDKLVYNFKKDSSFAQHVDMISPPWICRGDMMKKEGIKSEIQKPVFTTCDKDTPHYRLEASMIYLYDNDKIESWNTVIYLGDIPVFYFPYYSQPLKGDKKPYDIKFGHNDVSGWYVNTFYNIDFNQYNKWTLGFDYLEKIGETYHANMVYGIDANTTGTFNGSLTDDVHSDHKRLWSIDFSHNQIFNSTTRLNLRAQSLSDSDMAKNFLDTQGVDVFRHDYGASFSTSIGNNQTIGITASDAEVLNTITARYYTSARILPSLNYNLTSLGIIPGRLYYNHSFNINRIYNITDGGFYSDTAAFNPSVSLSLPSLYILSLSANAGLSSAWENLNENKKGFIAGDFVNSLTAGENASVDLLPNGYLKANLSHSYSKKLNKLDGAPHAGITSNMASIALSGGTGIINLNANATYDLLTDTAKTGFDVQRLSMISFSAYTGSGDVYFNSNGSYSPYANIIKNLSLSLGIRDMGPKSIWSFSMATNFVNNILDPTGREALIRLPDTMTFDTTLNFNFTPEFSFTVSRQYDLIIKSLTSQIYTASWHIHCWEANISWSKRIDNVEEYFFTVFISAIPEAKFNKPATSAPDYNMNQLMGN
jgi:lipopolysaccharide assembly outer membrane protein LptD (OstA)